MIPTSRKPKAITKKLSTPSPGLIGSGTSNDSKKLNKNDLLSKFQDPVDDDDDIFGTNEGGINFDDDFNTLRINDLDTLKAPQEQHTYRSKRSIHNDDNFAEFDQDDPEISNNFLHLDMSPIDSLSTSSPKSSLLTPSNRLGLVNNGYNSRKRSGNQGIHKITRKALSEYSEDDDTDVTSQLNEDDFEDLDNIFGSEETGIYEKINQKLVAKKLKMQNEAELEEAELQKKYHRQLHGSNKDINATLKLKDFNQYNNMESTTLTNQNSTLLDQLGNDKTISYEYTRDDFEDFADGFDNNFEKRLASASRKGPPRMASSQGMKSKISMPNLSRSVPSTIKKYKSSMDIANAYNSRNNFDLNEEDEFDNIDPGFNYNDNVIRKLDRIPSFYNPKTSSDLDTQKKKQQLLSRYVENSSHEKDSKSRRSRQHSQSKHKIGLVKYLNNNSIINNPTIPSNTKSMRYDSTNKRWEGNEADLLRFDSMHKPSLITLNDIKDNKRVSTLRNVITEPQNTDDKKQNANMVYDNENLRWINLNDDNESVFNDIPDLEDFKDTPTSNARSQSTYKLTSPPNFAPPQRMVASINGNRSGGSSPNINQSALGQQLQSPITRRGLSQFTQRTVSSNTNSTESDGAEGNQANEFQIPSKMVEKFLKEEEKISKKTCHWFSVHEEYDFTRNKDNGFSRDYYWEIRKMVIDNE